MKDPPEMKHKRINSLPTGICKMQSTIVLYIFSYLFEISVSFYPLLCFQEEADRCCFSSFFPPEQIEERAGRFFRVKPGKIRAVQQFFHRPHVEKSRQLSF